MKTLNVGIAGYGIVGKRRRTCIDANKALKLIAVCDKNFKSDGVFTDGTKYFQNFQTKRIAGRCYYYLSHTTCARASYL